MKLEPIVCASGQEFLEYLDPIKWNGWYFRGQPSDEYELIPSVWREKSDPRVKELYANFTDKMQCHINDMEHDIREGLFVNPYAHPHKFDVSILSQWYLFIKFENYLLYNFYDIANNAGLKDSRSSFGVN